MQRRSISTLTSVCVANRVAEGPLEAAADAAVEEVPGSSVDLDVMGPAMKGAETTTDEADERGLVDANEDTTEPEVWSAAA